MNFLESVLELVIFAKERGDEDLNTLAESVEKKIEAMHVAEMRRLTKRSSSDCEHCGAGTNYGIICRRCAFIAPEEVRDAFLNAEGGLDGMRKAVKLVRNWARGRRRKEAA